MKKFSAEPFFLAFFVLLTLFLQQIFLKKNAGEIKLIQQNSIHADSVNALSGKTGDIIKIYRSSLQNDSPESAAAWLKYGSMELQDPTVMLLYGDWLKTHGKNRRAGYFYRLALKKAKQKADGQLIAELEKRLEKQ